MTKELYQNLWRQDDSIHVLNKFPGPFLCTRRTSLRTSTLEERSITTKNLFSLPGRSLFTTHTHLVTRHLHNSLSAKRRNFRIANFSMCWHRGTKACASKNGQSCLEWQWAKPLTKFPIEIQENFKKVHSFWYKAEMRQDQERALSDAAE